MLAPEFTSFVVATPAMDSAQYARERGQLGELDEVNEGIRWVELVPARSARGGFWLRHFLPMLRRLWTLVSRADLVHAGTSHNLRRPLEFPALCFAWLQRKKSVCVVDMDLRDDARMNFLTGRWSRKSALL